MKKSQGEKQGFDNSTADRATRDAQTGRENAEIDKADSTLDYYGGKPEDSSLYKTLLTQRLDSTNQAYNNASAGARLRSRMGGFGYETPIGQEATTEVEGQRASELAKAPGEALTATVPFNMQAANMRLQAGSEYGKSAADYGGQAEGYFKTASDAEARRRQALMSAITSGAGLAASFIPVPKGARGPGATS